MNVCPQEIDAGACVQKGFFVFGHTNEFPVLEKGGEGGTVEHKHRED